MKPCRFIHSSHIKNGAQLTPWIHGRNRPCTYTARRPASSTYTRRHYCRHRSLSKIHTDEREEDEIQCTKKKREENESKSKWKRKYRKCLPYKNYLLGSNWMKAHATKKNKELQATGEWERRIIQEVFARRCDAPERQKWLCGRDVRWDSVLSDSFFVHYLPFDGKKFFRFDFVSHPPRKCVCVWKKRTQYELRKVLFARECRPTDRPTEKKKEKKKRSLSPSRRNHRGCYRFVDADDDQNDK